LVRKGYKKGFVACLISSAGTIGPVIPPSLMMIIYSSITGLSVATLFLGGFLPGIIMGIVLMILCYLYALRHPTGQEERLKLSIREIWRTFKQAWIALIMPVIIIGGIIFGVFTPTEAGAIAVMIAFVVGAFIYKEIDLKKCWKILISSAKTSAVVLLIVGMATLFGWILAINKFPQLSIAFLTNISKNPNVIMLIIIGFLLIVGCFVETVAALIIFTPFLYPICSQFGYDPIHFALVVIMTLLIGQVTPPLGILLFLSSAMTDVKIRESLKFIAPFIIMLTIAVLCVAYVPDFVLIIPKLILGYH
jgi:tripartite ATP-independent transporter DctM subunit